MAPEEREKCRPPRVTRGDVEAAGKKRRTQGEGGRPQTGDARRGREPKTGEDTGAGVKMKTQDEETRRMGRGAGDVGLEVVTEEGGGRVAGRGEEGVAGGAGRQGVVGEVEVLRGDDVEGDSQEEAEGEVREGGVAEEAGDDAVGEVGVGTGGGDDEADGTGNALGKW